MKTIQPASSILCGRCRQAKVSFQTERVAPCESKENTQYTKSEFAQFSKLTLKMKFGILVGLSVRWRERLFAATLAFGQPAGQLF